ncbi:MAG: hypothetical protein PGN23_06590 [Sphingomonas adhaesiva]|uniref:TetR/AcrR family transcriptional regulator n=1 Tax=Sphingomonas TaxID=13687 RepID=UPI002FFAD756
MNHKAMGEERRSRDLRVRRTRRRLREALVTLLADHELSAITARMVADRSGVGYATFFRHHADVEALLSDVAATLIAELAPPMLALGAAGDVRGIVDAIVRFVDANRTTCTALLVAAADATRRDLLRLALAAAEQGTAPVPAWLPRPLALIHQVSATFTAVGWWLEHAPSLPVAEAGEIIYHLAFEPTAPAMPPG